MKTSDFLNSVCEAMGRAPNSLSLDDTPQTVSEWDSIGHLAIIAAVDEIADGADSDDLRTFTSLRQLAEALKKRGILED